MADTRLRVDRTIAAMSEKQKAELLDLHIGPTLAGGTPDPESDAKYLRDLAIFLFRKDMQPHKFFGVASPLFRILNRGAFGNSQKIAEEMFSRDA